MPETKRVSSFFYFIFDITFQYSNIFEDQLNRRSANDSGGTPRSSRKRAKIDLSCSGKDVDAESSSSKEEDEIVSHVSTKFSPIYELSHYVSKKTMRRSASVIIWLPSGVGPGDHQAKFALRLVDEGCSLEIAILWPTCLQKLTTSNARTSVTTVHMKLLKHGIMLEDAEVVGFEEGLSNSRISTVHGMETNGVIPLGFACMTDFKKQNLGWSTCGSMAVYVRLESHTQANELHFDNSEFQMSSQSDTEGTASRF